MYLAFNLMPPMIRDSPQSSLWICIQGMRLRFRQAISPSIPTRITSAAMLLCAMKPWLPFPRTEYAVRTHRQEYYAIISHMDEQIGRILESLRKTGMQDNTYIIFTADHGLACGNHGLLGKQNMYEHSLKPPLIVVGPNFPADERRNAHVSLQGKANNYRGIYRRMFGCNWVADIV